MPSIFSKIIKGEIPCHKVWEDDRHFAFLDINPWTEGHTLVVPKIEHDYLFDMPDAEYAALHAAARTVAQLLKSKLGCRRVCTCVIGYEVPHVHIHLLPTNEMQDFAKPGTFGMKTKPDLAALAKRLSADSGLAQKFAEAFNVRDLAALKTLFAPEATAQVLGSPFPEERGIEEIAKKSLPHMLGEPDEPISAEAAKLDGKPLILFRNEGGTLETVGRITEAEGRVQRIEYLTSFGSADEIKSIELKLKLGAGR